MASNANGLYMDCGYGMPAAVTLSCQGPSCDSLDSVNFPNLTCTTDATGTHCTNGVICPGSPNFQSSFALGQQASQTTVTSTQNVTVDTQSFSGSDPGTGQPFSFTSLNLTSVPSGCAAAPAPAASTKPATPTLFTSAGNRRSAVLKHSYSNMIFALVMVMSFFVTQIHATSPVNVLDQIVSLFPPGYTGLLTQLSQVFCEQAVYPEIDTIVTGQENRARGVVDLVAACASMIETGEISSNATGNDPSTSFGLALGNLFVCNKISNTILEVGGSELCNIILAPAPTGTATVIVTSTEVVTTAIASIEVGGTVTVTSTEVVTTTIASIEVEGPEIIPASTITNTVTQTIKGEEVTTTVVETDYVTKIVEHTVTITVRPPRPPYSPPSD